MQRSNALEPPEAHVAHVQAAEPSIVKSNATHKGSRARNFAALLAAAVMGLVALILAYNLAHDGRVFRGAHVLGQDLGGMDRAEAQALLASAAAGYPADKITVKGSSKSWTFAPTDLGVVVDADRTLDIVFQVGRNGSLLDNVGTQASNLFNGTSLTPALKHDPALLDKAVGQLASELDRSAVNSTLIQAADGTVSITPSSVGSVVDRDALRASMSAAVRSLPFAVVTVSMREELPKITEAALQATKDQAMLLTERAITLKSGEREWLVQPAELRRMISLSEGDANKWDVALDREALSIYLEPVAADVKVEPIDASVTVGKGTVKLGEDEAGADLDVPATVAAIEKAATGQNAAARTVELVISETPARIQTEQVQALYTKLDALVSQGVRFHFRDDGYTVRGESITAFLDVAPGEGDSPFEMVVDNDVLATRIRGVAYNMNRPAADARFRMANGVPGKVAEAKDGYKVDVEKSVQRALSALDAYVGGDKLQVELDVAVTEPAVRDADLGAINTPDLLGSGQTSYADSSPERAYNVGLGTQRVDGALVPPGGVFSTVDTIGDLTLAAGFKMGYAIVNTGQGITTVPAAAGGICQVSTTLFHSVFWAGLPLVERNWHSYWIATYGRAPSGMLGLDATIAPPEKDFRFKNSTSNWILIKAVADGKTVTFELYGVNPGWKVKAGTPVITNKVKTTNTPVTEYSAALPAGKRVLVEHAQDGFHATISRTVTDASGNVVDQVTIKSRYAPARDRYLIGTGR